MNGKVRGETYVIVLLCSLLDLLFHFVDYFLQERHLACSVKLWSKTECTIGCFREIGKNRADMISRDWNWYT